MINRDETRLGMIVQNYFHELINFLVPNKFEEFFLNSPVTGLNLH